MFETYHNIPTSYTPISNYKSNAEHKCPLAEYNMKGEFIGYSWKRGDSIVLEFTTEGEVTYKDLEVCEDAELYLSNKTMTLSIFNFRHEVVYTESTVAQTVVKFYIDEYTSSHLIEGIYSCHLALTDDVNGTIYSLVTPDDYKLMIK